MVVKHKLLNVSWIKLIVAQEIKMKVVLFCGGLGTRLRDFSEAIPKPLVPIGYRPII